MRKLNEYISIPNVDMCIATKCDGRIAVITKHWTTINYIETTYSAFILWNGLNEIAKKYEHTLTHSKKGPYVFIKKLTRNETLEFFNALIERFEGNAVQKIGIQWDISDAYRGRCNGDPDFMKK